MAISALAHSMVSNRPADAAGPISPETIMGIVSVVLWSLVVIVSFKYAILIMRAGNCGEGGIVALLALLDVGRASSGSWRASLLIVGPIGAALLYGDGVLDSSVVARHHRSPPPKTIHSGRRHARLSAGPGQGG